MILEREYNNGVNNNNDTSMEIKRPPGPSVGKNNNFNTHTVMNIATPRA